MKVDAIVVGVTKGSDGVSLDSAAADIDRAFKGRLAATVQALGGTGRANEVTKIASLGAIQAPVVLAVGLGPLEGDARDESKGGKRKGKSNAVPAYDVETLRRAAGTAIRALAGSSSVAIALPADDAVTAAAVAEGALLGAYAYHAYRVTSKKDHKDVVAAITVVSDAAKDKAVKAAVARARTISEAVHLTRDWVNTPPKDFPPAEFAAAAVRAAEKAGLKVEVLDEKALEKGGYGGILGVGQGSARPPRLVKITYTAGKGKPNLALVGKGITFDSGGLSLKPSASMEWMKADMAGAAAVVAAVTAIARLKTDVNVTVWAPMAENLPSGDAQRPSDVLRIYGGKTVEVLNTDAEGRLVLADGLVRASEDKPDLIVDVATLTGAQAVALGNRTSAVMANDDEVRNAIVDAAGRAGEQMWPMPLPSELDESMKSDVADIANMGDKYGGMLVAGLFLKSFVGPGLRWAHLDIAGPSYNQVKPYGYTPKGGTGAAVRTLVQLAEDVAAGII
jgi:leucyl aminopeptidase